MTTMQPPAEPRREIATWQVGLMAIGWLIATVSLIFGFPLICLIGAILIGVVAFLAYSSQGRASGTGSFGAPALHRDLAKIHCGTCGASMRSNMAFCPVCGAPQVKT
ncbi:MAG: DUF2530 domain-containing protein [Thaumarchaeota archaeon]|nr:DUF2530 domain-containing protein [Nitrososphaerota archaeon]